MADVIAMLFVADVIATVMYFYLQILLPYYVGRCYCHDLYIAKFVADVIATVAVVVTTCGNDVSFYCRCYGHFRLMLVPCLNVAVFLADVITTMGDGIAIYETFVIGRCCLPGWKMQQPTRVSVWSDVITMCGR